MKRATDHRSRRSPGFTLGELMVTIVLIGLLFGMVFVKMDGLVPSQRLKSSARELASSLDLARNYAVVSGHPVKFEYDLDEELYRYYVPFEMSEDGQQILGPGEFELRDWTALADNVEIKDVMLYQQVGTSNIMTVTFEPRGIATDHVVHLGFKDVDVRDTATTVIVNPLLGYIDIVDGYYVQETLNKSAF